MARTGRRSASAVFGVLRATVARSVTGMSRSDERFGRETWLAATVLAGVLPLLICWALGLPGQQWASAGCLFPLLLGAAHRQQSGRFVAGVALAFLAHSVVAIGIAASGSEASAVLFPGGDAYWQESRAWITTGQHAEAQVSAWLPAHLQLGAATVVLGVTTLGLAPLYEGFYEVDLMNVYVGRLLVESLSPVRALVLGWHVWSVLRGLCYALVLYEVSAFAVACATGRQGDGGKARRWRCACALTCFLLDVSIKAALTEPVRLALLHNLRD